MRTRKKVYLALASGILVLNIGCIGLTGCTKAGYPPPRQEWLSVTKPPIQVIYVSQTKITPAQVHNIIRQTKLTPFRNYPFNDVTGISLSADVNRQHHQSTSNTDSTSVTLNGGRARQ